MKILIDGRTITEASSGVGYVVISLLRELSKQKELEFVVLTRKGVSKVPGLPKLQTYEMDRDYQFVGFNRFEFEQHHLPHIVRSLNPDIIHLTDSFGLPILRDKSKKYLLTLHDLIPMTQYRELMTKIGGIFYDISIRLSVNGADRIVCISDFTKKDLKHYFPNVDDSRVEMVHNGVDFVSKLPNQEKIKKILNKFDVSRPYFFYVGGFSPRKNTLNLIKAFAEFNKKHNNKYQLILAGRLSQKPDIVKTIAKMKDHITENNLETTVKLLGYVSAEEKLTLLAGATSLTYLSYYEGFGLPVIEAFSMGTPVITSTDSAMQEVAGESALYADPDKIDDMSRAFQVMVDQHNIYAEKARVIVSVLKNKYNWAKAAKQYIILYQKLYEK